MACYYGLATQSNQVAWVVFILLFLPGIIMTPLGLGFFVPCYNTYLDCTNDYPMFSVDDWRNPCRPAYEDCGLVWARVFIAGIVLLGVSIIPQCYFCCCAQRPLNQDGYPQVATAVAVPMQPYAMPPPGGYNPGAYPPQQGAYGQLPAGAYPSQQGAYAYAQGPYQQPVQGMPVAGQPYAAYQQPQAGVTPYGGQPMYGAPPQQQQPSGACAPVQPAQA